MSLGRGEMHENADCVHLVPQKMTSPARVEICDLGFCQSSNCPGRKIAPSERLAMHTIAILMQKIAS